MTITLQETNKTRINHEIRRNGDRATLLETRATALETDVAALEALSDVFAIIPAGGRTLTNTASQQALFGTATDTLTVSALSTYFFEALIHLSGMSASSGNFTFSIKGAGSATITSCKWVAHGLDATTLTTAAATGTSLSTGATGTGNIVTAAIGTAVAVTISGIARINAAGTLIPSVALTNTSAATVEAGSHIRLRPVGTNTVASVGAWA